MVYLRLTTSNNEVQVSLVSKTKVAPIRQVLGVPLSQLYAWTDSTIVSNWLDGSPRRFKTYVRNRISTIMELLPVKA